MQNAGNDEMTPPRSLVATPCRETAAGVPEVLKGCFDSRR